MVLGRRMAAAALERGGEQAGFGRSFWSAGLRFVDIWSCLLGLAHKEHCDRDNARAKPKRNAGGRYFNRFCACGADYARNGISKQPRHFGDYQERRGFPPGRNPAATSTKRELAR